VPPAADEAVSAISTLIHAVCLSERSNHRYNCGMYAITSEDDRASEVAADLRTRLKRFNERQAGPINRRDIAATIRNERGQIIAGLAGEVFWNSFYVHLLWVEEEYRRQGFGGRLLRHAERLAVEASCDCVYLSTFEFQAPGFYAKQGYSVIGELPDVPKGSRRQWFAKTVSA
jgi:GNAT superfamily N-acetyltransferase